MKQSSASLTNTTPAHTVPHGYHRAFSALSCVLLIAGSGLLMGCPPDNTPLLQENEELTKQVTKKDSMLKTLEEGNRVLQEQINRLSQELRDKESTLTQQLQSIKEAGRNLVSDNQKLTQQTTQLAKDKAQLSQLNQKLQRDNDWLRRQREVFRQSLQANLPDARSQQLPASLRDAASATTQALSQHGYALIGTMATDQRAVFVTERKTSISTSIELPGFRNQYVVLLEATTANQTTLNVKAYYEKLGVGGKSLEVGPKEITEIEQRLIQAIGQTLKGPEKKA